MKKTRYTEEQIAYALKQAETGTAVAEVIRRMGISEQTVQSMMDPVPDPFALPAAQIVVDCLPWRQVVRKAATRDLVDAILYLTRRRLGRRPSSSTAASLDLTKTALMRRGSVSNIDDSEIAISVNSSVRSNSYGSNQTAACRHHPSGARGW